MNISQRFFFCIPFSLCLFLLQFFYIAMRVLVVCLYIVRACIRNMNEEATWKSIVQKENIQCQWIFRYSSDSLSIPFFFSSALSLSSLFAIYRYNVCCVYTFGCMFLFISSTSLLVFSLCLLILWELYQPERNNLSECVCSVVLSRCVRVVLQQINVLFLSCLPWINFGLSKKFFDRMALAYSSK